VQFGADHIVHAEHSRRAGCEPLPRYHRREPEKTLLHNVVRSRLEPFLAAARRTGSGRVLPGHVERELRSYVDCGILARGFARVRCPGCGFERLVAFSCKASICPSCATRRMDDVADHLCRSVFPVVPVRQWVLSLPRTLRFRAARESSVASRLLDIFTRAVFAWQRRAARRTGVVDPRTGGVTLVQRFGGAINLNVHFHTLVPDGVFVVNGQERARFIRLPAPDDEDVEGILTRVIKQVHKAFPAPGDVGGADEDDPFAALQAAEVDRRLRFPDPFRHTRRSAHLDGFSLHAGVRVHENDRAGLERLCRYAARPPFAVHRLTAGPEGKLVYRMKRPRGGSLFLLLAPDELLARTRRSCDRRERTRSGTTAYSRPTRGCGRRSCRSALRKRRNRSCTQFRPPRQLGRPPGRAEPGRTVPRPPAPASPGRSCCRRCSRWMSSRVPSAPAGSR